MTRAGRIVIALLLAGGLVALGWHFSARESGSEPIEARSPAPRESHPIIEPVAQSTQGMTRTPLERDETEIAPPEAVPLEEGIADETATLIVSAVREDTGAPLDDLEIKVGVDRRASLGWDGWIDLHSGRTNRRGVAAFEVPAGDLLSVLIEGTDPGLRNLIARRELGVEGELVSATGRAWAEVSPLRTGERRKIRLEVPIGRVLTVWGRTVDENGNPVPGTEIWKQVRGYGQIDLTDLERDGELLAVSGNDGLFEVEVHSLSRHCLYAIAPGLVPAYFLGGENNTTPETAVIVQLDGGARLSVSLDGVIDPGEEWRVKLQASLAREGSECASINDLGWIGIVSDREPCVFNGLPSNEPVEAQLLDSSDEIRRSTTISWIAAGETHELRWTLGAGTRIHGMLIDQFDQPVRGFPVQLVFESRLDRPTRCTRRVPPHHERALETETDSAGHFEFEDVDPGFWWLGPDPDSLAEPDWELPPGGLSDAAIEELDRQWLAEQISEVAELVEVTGDLAELEVDLRAHRGLYIEGCVLGPDDALVDDAWIMAVHEDRQVRLEDHPFGGFRIGPLVPGEYELWVRSPFLPLCGPVRVSAGDTDVVVRLPAAVALRGRLVDATTGEGLEGTVWASSGGPPESVVECDSIRGFFEEEAVAEGVYDIVGVSEDGKCGILRAVQLRPRVAPTGLLIEAHPAARLIVRYRGRHSECCTVHLGGVLVGAGYWATMNSTVVPAGDLVVKLWRFGEVVEQREVTLAVGQSKEIRFE